MKIKRKKKRVVKKTAPAVQSESKAGQYKSIEDVITPDMIAYHYWREWFSARDRNDWSFMFDMTTDESPLREQLGDRDSFAERCRRRDRGVPGLRPGNLQKIRLDGPDVAQVLRVVGLDDRTRREIVIERWFMLRGVEGWNMVAVDEVTCPRDADIDISHFEAIEIPEGFVGRSQNTEQPDAEESDAAPQTSAD